MHHQGLTDLTPKSYTALGLMNIGPSAITVSEKSPYKNMNDMLTAIKANPGKLKASGTGQVGIWHIHLDGMLKSLKSEHNAVPFVPSTGAAHDILELAAAGTDLGPAALHTACPERPRTRKGQSV